VAKDNERPYQLFLVRGRRKNVAAPWASGSFSVRLAQEKKHSGLLLYDRKETR